MDELRGPIIQIVLHVKEGLGFGFLRSPFIVSGSLNGYMLETDPTVPSHAPVFDAELVWEADKRRFRSLRVQNVPVKVEVYTTGSQGRKDKVGYLLLSLLGAQPCPANKFVDVKHSWHKLLGVKSEGKCCHPQLLMSLTIEDRVSTPTPRNELRMFHSNEIVNPSSRQEKNPPASKSILLKVEEYIAESKRVASSIDLQPKLICEEGLIQIGDGNHLFLLSLVIGSVENLDLLLPSTLKETAFSYVTYTVFTHNIMTDRVSATTMGNTSRAQFNQRTSLRLQTDLSTLGRYFAECPHLVTRVCVGEKDVGICSMDLRKLIPTDDIELFITNFCQNDKSLTVHERCFILRCDDVIREGSRRPYMDVELSLKYLGVKKNSQKPLLTARSATQLKVDPEQQVVVDSEDILIQGRAGSCTDLGGLGGYRGVAPSNTARYTNASGEAMLPTNEIAELIKKMCDTFASSQEKLLATHKTTSDMQIQCDDVQEEKNELVGDTEKEDNNLEDLIEREPVKLEATKSDTCFTANVRDAVNKVMTAADRDTIMQKYVDELEDWKEQQQKLFKIQLKRKEDYHLELLAGEWAKRRAELEGRLARGVEQCRQLAADLSRATGDFALRGHRNAQRERKLLEAKKALEEHYTAKYKDLREASQKMEDDMNHQLKVKDRTIEDLQLKIQKMENIIDGLKMDLKNVEKDAESRCSGLTKDQTASLIQELVSKYMLTNAFFKEQWGRAVRELHRAKLAARRQLLHTLRDQRRQLADGLDPIEDQEEIVMDDKNEVDINKLKDDFYVDILANSPAMESRSLISTSGPEGMEIYDDLIKAPINPMNTRLKDLMSQREQLVANEQTDEQALRALNTEIRNILINCAT
ncbi:uncharacterized protein LOC119839800 [Zerene cesonia]|uniref:uncharacterized protein LOC119839800 n=1 Tax=Zerene cesonia TaxID=33412 RepID=UPI0018E584BA|nr:uncharacterized protein LOC119839800 [Zerene cesonia]